jgi:acyl-CoA synthetase (AMP-forming)/AMP-acid ligase II
MSLDLLTEINAVSARTPGAIALIEESGRRITYAALATRIARVTAALRALGIRRGDRVLFAIRPSETAVVTIIALMELGAVLVAAHLGVGDELFASQMQTVRPSWVFTETVILAAMRNRLARGVLRSRGTLLPSFKSLHDVHVVVAGRWLPGLGTMTRLERIENSARAVTIANVDAATPERQDDALIVFTSGTTSAPRAVVHTRSSLAATLDAVAAGLPVTPGHCILARDLHLIIPALRSGASAFVPASQQMSPAAMLAAIERHRITHVFEVTAHLERLVAHLEQTGGRFPAHIEQMLVGAAPVRHAFFERLSRRIGHATQAWCVYGMTEMLPVAAIELREKLQFAGIGDVVGTPVRGVDARVDDKGELTVAGPHLFHRYLGDEPVERHATGDLATIDAAGRVVLLGRRKDMIIRGANNIYPALHEQIVERIAGVQRAAMIGVFDEERADERVILVVEPVVALESREEISRFTHQVATALRTTHRIDHAALPDDIIVATVPLSGRSSKVDKAQLRTMLRNGSL